MKRKDAFNKYIGAVYNEGVDKGHAIAMGTMMLSCGIMMILDIIEKKKKRKTIMELCENNLNNHVYLDEDDEE